MSRVALIGLGAMGAGMAARLIEGGKDLLVLDKDPTKTAAAAALGARVARDLPAMAEAADIILMSLPSPDIATAVAVDLLPLVPKGGIVVDLGTMTPTATRELAAQYRGVGAAFLDAPVTGGPGGAAGGGLRIFLGGDREGCERASPILAELGDVLSCGGAGAGQAVKLVNQLCMGLTNAVLLEAISFGMRMGIEPEFLGRAIGGEAGWRHEFTKLAARVANGDAAAVGIKHGQIPYVLAEAERLGSSMPLSQAAYQFIENDPAVIPEANRLSPSFWLALTRQEKG